MCRLYGFRSNELTKVECTLAYAQNGLLNQSRADLRGESHPDGWGIAHYDDTVPHLVRRHTAAYSDVHFSRVAERAYARTVIAHVRRATIGGAHLENTHPFTFDRWSFAHNGTIRAFDELGPQMEREIPSQLLELRDGGTDSELAFYWILAMLQRDGVSLEAPVARADLANAVARAVCILDSRCIMAGADEPARLNFVMTDGNVLCASRWGNSLHWVARDGIHDCEICGIPHVKHESGKPYRALVLASEQITDEPWEELEEGMLLTVDEHVTPELQRI